MATPADPTDPEPLGSDPGAGKVVVDPHLADGHMLIHGDGTIVIGTRPLTPIEAAGREGRMLVRRGLADVLTWLGEPVYTEPTSAEILDSLRRNGAGWAT